LKVKPTAENPTGAPSPAEKFLIALYGGAEATVPYLATARRLREGGGTPYADSTVVSPRTKPGSAHMSAVRRTLDPLRPTYLKQPSSGGGAAAAGGIDSADLHDIREAVQDATAGGQLDRHDLDEIRQALRGR
jgi:hypothetical protein